MVTMVTALAARSSFCASPARAKCLRSYFVRWFVGSLARYWFVRQLYCLYNSDCEDSAAARRLSSRCFFVGRARAFPHFLCPADVS